MKMSFCNEVRIGFTKMVGQEGFTTKEFARKMGFINDNMSPGKIGNIMTKITDEAKRCRAYDDNLVVNPKKGMPAEKSDHAHMMEELGVRLYLENSKPSNSEGKRRSAHRFKVEAIDTQKVSTSMNPSVGNTYEQITALAIQQATDQQLIGELYRRSNNG
jgi:hypothetical protein